MKKIVTVLALTVIVCAAIVCYNYLKISSKQIPAEGIKTDIRGITGAEERLAQSLTFKTVSYEDSSQTDFGEFLKFHEFLKISFPNVFSTLNLELINNYTIILHWKGKDSQLKPGVILAHQDVVPVLEDTRDLWSVNPFEGVIKEGVLWGRGAVDDKINLMAQLEAVEFLIQDNYTPERDIYLIFGHDEELGGEQGALKAAQWMQRKGIEAEFVLDEGGFVTNEKVPGMSQPVALIGTSEKGYLNLELSVRIEGGHSSMPNEQNAIKAMSEALICLSQNPFKPELTPSVHDFIAHIAPHSSFLNRLAMSNLWLFKPLVFKIYSQTGAGNAMIRTSMVPTIIRGGEKSNVIPDVVTAIVNFRLLPGTTAKDAIAHTKKAINNPLISVTPLSEQLEASEISPIDTDAFRLISNSIHLNFENVIATPFLMIGGTDSKHFNIVSKNIYKFSPMLDPIGFHGVNERLDLETYPKAIGFYTDLLKGL